MLNLGNRSLACLLKRNVAGFCNLGLLHVYLICVYFSISFFYIICTESFHLFHDWQFAMVIYNTKIMLVINCKDVRSYRFPWPPSNFVLHYLVLGSYSLVIKICWAPCDHLFYISIHIDPLC